MAGPRGSYGIIGLVVVVVLFVVFLPNLRNTFAPMFPEGFRDIDCKGVNCQEGEFCQQNTCHKISPSITNDYFKMM
jgi:hypothetical protein